MPQILPRHCPEESWQMPEQSREHITKDTLMTVGQYLNPNYGPFEASSTNSASNTQPLLSGLTWPPIRKILDSFL